MQGLEGIFYDQFGAIQISVHVAPYRLGVDHLLLSLGTGEEVVAVFSKD